jgi:hypothetical protein
VGGALDSLDGGSFFVAFTADKGGVDMINLNKIIESLKFQCSVISSYFSK